MKSISFPAYFEGIARLYLTNTLARDPQRGKNGRGVEAEGIQAREKVKWSKVNSFHTGGERERHRTGKALSFLSPLSLPLLVCMYGSGFLFLWFPSSWNACWAAYEWKKCCYVLMLCLLLVSYTTLMCPRVVYLCTENPQFSLTLSNSQTLWRERERMATEANKSICRWEIN